MKELTDRTTVHQKAETVRLSLKKIEPKKLHMEIWEEIGVSALLGDPIGTPTCMNYVNELCVFSVQVSALEVDQLGCKERACRVQA